MYGMPLNDSATLEKYVYASFAGQKKDAEYRDLIMKDLRTTRGEAGFWYGELVLPCSETTPKETFLNLPGWSKGVVFINGFNLGRYWPIVGPQQTLYVPSTLLVGSCRKNKVIIFEQETPGCGNSVCSIEFVDTPVIDGPTPKGSELGEKLPSFTRP
jgi:hypothetical protein